MQELQNMMGFTLRALEFCLHCTWALLRPVPTEVFVPLDICFSNAHQDFHVENSLRLRCIALAILAD